MPSILPVLACFSLVMMLQITSLPACFAFWEDWLVSRRSPDPSSRGRGPRIAGLLMMVAGCLFTVVATCVWVALLVVLAADTGLASAPVYTMLGALGTAPAASYVLNGISRHRRAAQWVRLHEPSIRAVSMPTAFERRLFIDHLHEPLPPALVAAAVAGCVTLLLWVPSGTELPEHEGSRVFFVLYGAFLAGASTWAVCRALIRTLAPRRQLVRLVVLADPRTWTGWHCNVRAPRSGRAIAQALGRHLRASIVQVPPCLRGGYTAAFSTMQHILWMYDDQRSTAHGAASATARHGRAALVAAFSDAANAERVLQRSMSGYLVLAHEVNVPQRRAATLLAALTPERLQASAQFAVTVTTIVLVILTMLFGIDASQILRDLKG
ncbi:hypothetical protein [Kineococcus arenarius]|uniref:hypothetical protein n=1 Tax=unclassified Kineococcus TaxID=2621656 RepID=UPI003D7E5D0A